MAVIDVRERAISLPEYVVEQPAINSEQEVIWQLEVSVLPKNVSGSQVELPETGEICYAAAPAWYANVTSVAVGVL